MLVNEDADMRPLRDGEAGGSFKRATLVHTGVILVTDSNRWRNSNHEISSPGASSVEGRVKILERSLLFVNKQKQKNFVNLINCKAAADSRGPIE